MPIYSCLVPFYFRTTQRSYRMAIKLKWLPSDPLKKVCLIFYARLCVFSWIYEHPTELGRIVYYLALFSQKIIMFNYKDKYFCENISLLQNRD